MFPVLPEGHAIEDLVDFGHLLSEYAWILRVHLGLRLHAIHLPYLQHRVLPARREELPVRRKLSHPDCPVVCADTLNEEEFEIVCGFFVRLSCGLVMDPGSNLQAAKHTVVHVHVLLIFKFHIVYIDCTTLELTQI